MATSPEEQLAAMVASLKEKTGTSLEQWSALASASGKAKHGEIVAWLKGEHGMTHGYANLVAHTTLKSDAGSKSAAGDDLVAEMFAGDKAALRPIYEVLMTTIIPFGPDIEQAPKKGYMSLRRRSLPPCIRRPRPALTSGSSSRASNRRDVSRRPGAGTRWCRIGCGWRVSVTRTPR